MYRRAALALLVTGSVFLTSIAAAAQVLQPTPAPLVTAENESWFLNGEPITYGGHFYYPAGAQVFFNANEMVRSGFYLGIPLYTRTTIEPFSIVYVPVAGGRMQPYERARADELAGTSGSRPLSAATPYAAASLGRATLEAAAPPTQTAPALVIEQRPAGTAGAAPPQAVGTAGRVAAAPGAPPTHVRIGGTPTGVNAIFIRFRNQRWLTTGHTLELDRERMEKIGDYNGFDVWAYRGDPDRIYLPVTRDSTLVVPYSRDKRDLK